MLYFDIFQSSFANTQFECTCIHTMIKYYKWLFQVAEDENRKDEVRMPEACSSAARPRLAVLGKQSC